MFSSVGWVIYKGDAIGSHFFVKPGNRKCNIRGVRTCCSFSLPYFAFSETVHWYNCDVIGGQGSKSPQHCRCVATRYFGGQLAPSWLRLVSNAVVEYISRCRLPSNFHALLRLIRDNNYSTIGWDCKETKKTSWREIITWIYGPKENVGFVNLCQKCIETHHFPTNLWKHMQYGIPLASNLNSNVPSNLKAFHLAFCSVSTWKWRQVLSRISDFKKYTLNRPKFAWLIVFSWWFWAWSLAFSSYPTIPTLSSVSINICTTVASSSAWQKALWELNMFCFYQKWLSLRFSLL